ncbi:substrate-binding domain-containing protein [Streptomyces sp. NPDC058382]|uniref:substrate-binding domain-containing protein n=1 Tax=unclassified Streptomyces TaxID=2593676 RepID=UPI003642D0CE
MLLPSARSRSSRAASLPMRLGAVSGPLDFRHSRERMDAWRCVLWRSGLSPSPPFEGDFTYDGGQVAADHLLGLDEPPTAVLRANDLTAIALMIRAQDLGVRVPDDLLVAGYHDGITFGTYVLHRMGDQGGQRWTSPRCGRGM